jgi:hypothetical protein
VYFLCKNNTFLNLLYKEVKYAGTFTKNRILLLLIYTGNKPGTSYAQVWEGKLKNAIQYYQNCIYALQCKGNVFMEAMKVAHSRNTFVISVASTNPELFSWNCGVDNNYDVICTKRIPPLVLDNSRSNFQRSEFFLNESDAFH